MYKISNGVHLRDDLTVFDERVNCSYSNVILTKILIDVNLKKLHDMDEYLNSIELNVDKKEKIDECVQFSIKNNLITNSLFLFKSTIWYRSRLLMTLSIIVRIIVFSCFCIPFIYINSFINSSVLSYLTEFYVVFNLIAHIHELSHAVSYWRYEKHVNGYFSYNIINFVFVFNIKNISAYQNRIIALSGVSVSCLILSFMYLLFDFQGSLIIMNILLQIILFFIGSDFQILRDTFWFKH